MFRLLCGQLKVFLESIAICYTTPRNHLACMLGNEFVFCCCKFDNIYAIFLFTLTSCSIFSQDNLITKLFIIFGVLCERCYPLAVIIIFQFGNYLAIGNL